MLYTYKILNVDLDSICKYLFLKILLTLNDGSRGTLVMVEAEDGSHCGGLW
jgi:hypothetical protein